MEWINVKEKLPEINKAVLCCYYPKQPIMEGRTIGILRRHELPNRKNEFIRSLLDENGFGNASQVTHWIPLPKLPTL